MEVLQFFDGLRESNRSLSLAAWPPAKPPLPPGRGSLFFGVKNVPVDGIEPDDSGRLVHPACFLERLKRTVVRGSPISQG